MNSTVTGTCYIQSDSRLLKELTTPAAIAAFKTRHGIAFDPDQIYDAYVQAYNHVFAEQLVSQASRSDDEVRRMLVSECLRVLEVKRDTGLLYSRMAVENSKGAALLGFPLYTRDIRHKDTLTTPQPRKAHAYGMDTRHTVIPLSNRALSSHEIRQMRGVATSGVLDSIIG